MLPVVAILVLWPFNFDAGLTRLGKALRLEKFWEPHRDHIYQKLTLAGFSAGFVSALYGLMALAAGLAAIALLTSNKWSAFFLVVVILLISFTLAVMTKRLGRPARS